jgi:mRNA-degrading endonuclease RelE of RelBE toxin-antitoxin system
MYVSEFDQGWHGYFQPLDPEIKSRVAKKIKKILEYPQKRHLKKVSFFVAEVAQYRIIYKVFEDNNRVRFYFIGNHKDYEKWYRQGF